MPLSISILQNQVGGRLGEKQSKIRNLYCRDFYFPSPPPFFTAIHCVWYCDVEMTRKMIKHVTVFLVKIYGSNQSVTLLVKIYGSNQSVHPMGLRWSTEYKVNLDHSIILTVAWPFFSVSFKKIIYYKEKGLLNWRCSVFYNFEFSLSLLMRKLYYISMNLDLLLIHCRFLKNFFLLQNNATYT